MNVEINQLTDEKLLVNNKLVYIDPNGNVNAKIELTQAETEALNNHLFKTE